jgi:CTP synthase
MVTVPILYQVPLMLEEAGVADYILQRFGLKKRIEPNWDEWKNLIKEVKRSKPTVNIAIVGKYVELHDAYMSVREALFHAALAVGIEVNIQWIYSVDLEKDGAWEILKQCDGIVVPGGFGTRGTEGKILAARYARENLVPYLGLCLGMQLMVVEFGRPYFEQKKSTLQNSIVQLHFLLLISCQIKETLPKWAVQCALGFTLVNLFQIPKPMQLISKIWLKKDIATALN